MRRRGTPRPQCTPITKPERNKQTNKHNRRQRQQKETGTETPGNCTVQVWSKRLGRDLFNFGHTTAKDGPTPDQSAVSCNKTAWHCPDLTSNTCPPSASVRPCGSAPPAEALDDHGRLLVAAAVGQHPDRPDLERARRWGAADHPEDRGLDPELVGPRGACNPSVARARGDAPRLAPYLLECCN